MTISKSMHGRYVIVLGLDYSEPSEFAFEQALSTAALRVPCDVHVVHVVQLLAPIDGLGFVPSIVSTAVPLDEAERELRRRVDAKLDEIRRTSGERALDGILVTPHLVFGTAGRELAQMASDLEADLIVVGSHGRRGAARLLLGSVAELVTRLAPCPVLVVRPRRIVEIPRILPPCPECVAIRRATGGKRFWCDQHSQHHGRPHTYSHADRIAADGTMPLVIPE